jgi:tRNA (cytidine/uridine-2'-O-)-methyltransferase
MFHVVLYRPEIPPNTGNLMRLCVNTGCRLHLVHPLGFELDDARLRRAGLDYKEYANVAHYDDFDGFVDVMQPQRVYAYSQHATRRYTEVRFEPGDTLLFGPESVGLPSELMAHPAVTESLRIPIAPGGRSLNLANAAAIAIYEAWRQQGFAASRVRESRTDG